MHLAIDAVGAKNSGGATVLVDLLTAAIADNRVDRISVFSSPRALRSFDLPASPKIVELEQPVAERGYARLAWWLWMLPQQCRRVGADALFCCAGAGSGARERSHITFIQQPNPFCPETLRRQSRRARVRYALIRALMQHSCRRSFEVQVQTETMRRSVIDMFRLDARKVTVFPPSVQPFAEVGDPPPADHPMQTTPPGSRILYVGSAQVHKNIGLMVQGMPLIRQRLPDARLFVTWPQDHPFCDGDRVVALGHLSRSAVCDALKLATVLVMPSLVETVGLPMLEAMSVGTPVAAADRPYAHDVCEDAAVFFDPLRPESYARALTHLMGDAAQCADLITRGHALVAKRAAWRPYSRMVDTLVAAAASAAR